MQTAEETQAGIQEVENLCSEIVPPESTPAKPALQEAPGAVYVKLQPGTNKIRIHFTGVMVHGEPFIPAFEPQQATLLANQLHKEAALARRRARGQGAKLKRR